MMLRRALLTLTCTLGLTLMPSTAYAGFSIGSFIKLVLEHRQEDTRMEPLAAPARVGNAVPSRPQAAGAAATTGSRGAVRPASQNQH